MLFTIKEHKRRGGSGTAKTYWTNVPIIKSNGWNQKIVMIKNSIPDVAAVPYRSLS